MIKIFFYWLFQRSKTLQGLVNINTHKKVSDIVQEKYSTRDQVIKNLFDALQVNKNKFLRRKWNRITTNQNSPFYIYK